MTLTVNLSVSLMCKGLLAQGMVQGEELLQAYASADVFMMPSESETLGFVVLEAMASGLPVVAVAAGGLTDILTEPGETGAARGLVSITLNPRGTQEGGVNTAGRVSVAALSARSCAVRSWACVLPMIAGDALQSGRAAA